MSVINKMLRDLDQRQQTNSQNRTRSFRPHRKNPLLLWFAIPAALLAGWLGQSWYEQHQLRQSTPSPVVQNEPKKPLDPVALAAEFVPEIAELEKQKTALMGTSEQTVSVKDVIASKIPPEVAAKLNGPSAAGNAVVDTTAQPEKAPRLESFASQGSAQERVVQVQALTAEELSALQQAEQDDNAEVLVESYPQQPDLQMETVAPLQQEQQPPAKPRSLAIEKVELTREEQLVLLREKAAKAESAGQLAQAAEYWHLIRQTAPESSQAYLELARLAQIQGNDAEAFTVLQQASLSVGQEPKVAMALAALALKQQDWQKALSYLDYNPDIVQYADFYVLKAAALQKTNQHSQAIEVFQQLARQQPDQARWWLGMALSYDALQQLPQAVVAYRQAQVNGASLSAASLDYVKKRIAAIE